MKIESSAISMLSSHNKQEVHTKEENLQVWIGDKQPQGNSSNASLNDVLQLSDEGKKKLEVSKADVQKTDNSTELDFSISDKDKQKIMLIQKMLEVLTGKKIKFSILENLPSNSHASSISFNSSKGATPEASQRKGWGLSYNYHEAHSESESTSFSANGIIKTTDGRSINFQTTLNMNRSFTSETNLSIRKGDAAIDPLVINFNGNAPQLTDSKFSFDLDLDGNSEQMSFLKEGSGFLAIDLNNDGKVNDGGELFGPKSGNGFNELSKYDSDNNNWIDENDPVFDKLRVWTKDENGNDQLFAIGKKGIGAIYLGNINTAFDMKDGNNNLQGKLHSSGVYVNENGTVGTVSEIDLVI